MSLPPPLDSRKRALALSDTETDLNLENDWATARNKKQSHNDNQTTATQKTASQIVTRFRVDAGTSTDSYRKISAFNLKHPNLKLTARPNLRGEWILTSHDNNTKRTLRNTSDLALTELNRNNRMTKRVVTDFPFSIPGTELAKHEKIAHVERMKNKDGQETNAMLCSFIEEWPDRINLGIWGTYPLRTYYPEPLRCFNCQKFGHHKSACQSSAKCAVCSGRHETSTCISKHKGGEQTHPRCPNCKSNHPTWSRRCPKRLNGIKASLPNEPERKTPLPKPRKQFYTRAELQKRSTSKTPRENSQKRALSMTSFNQSRNTPVTVPKTILCHTDNIRNCFSSFVQVALISENAHLSMDKIKILSQDFMESLWRMS